MDENRKNNIETVKYIRENESFDLEKFIDKSKKMSYDTIVNLVRTLKQANNDYYEKLYDEGMDGEDENWSQKIKRDVEVLYIELAKQDNAPVYEIAEAIVDGENPYWIFTFASQVHNAPKNMLAYSLIDILRRGEIDEEETAKYMYMFAKYIKGAPVEDMARSMLCNSEVVECQASKYLLKFAELVSGELKIRLIRRYKESQRILAEERKNYQSYEEDEADEIESE